MLMSNQHQQTSNLLPPAADALARATSTSRLTHIVITHLDPNRIPSLEAVLQRVQAAGARPQLILSNPALRILQTSISEWKRPQLGHSHTIYELAACGAQHYHRLLGQACGRWQGTCGSRVRV